jgi:hypothetical protein
VYTIAPMTTRKPSKPRVGRPPTRGETATKVLPMRMTEAEHANAHRLADARGVDVSTMIRTWLALGAPMPPAAAAGCTVDAPAAAPARPVAAPAPAAAPARPVAAPAQPAASKPTRRAKVAAKHSNRPKRGR